MLPFCNQSPINPWHPLICFFPIVFFSSISYKWNQTVSSILSLVLLLSKMHLRFAQVVACIIVHHSFLLLRIPLYGYTSLLVYMHQLRFILHFYFPLLLVIIDLVKSIGEVFHSIGRNSSWKVKVRSMTLCNMCKRL